MCIMTWYSILFIREGTGWRWTRLWWKRFCRLASSGRTWLSLIEKKEKERKTEKLKKLSPGDPGVPGLNPALLGSQNPKTVTLGDPGYPERIPRVEGIPT